MSEQPKRTETVEEYLQRGGTITRLPDSHNSFYAVEFENPTATTKSNPLKENLEIYGRLYGVEDLTNRIHEISEDLNRSDNSLLIF